jgi:hypothetical protein
MKQSASRQLYSHWNEMRRGRVSPERADMDPAMIRGCLADSFMLEIDAALTYPFRLCGTRLAALFTQEPKGRGFLEFWDAASVRDIAALIACVHDEATIIVAGVRTGGLAPAPGDYELLLLPLRHLGKTHARIMGCLAPVAVPAWIGLVEGYPLGLRSWRSISQAALRLSDSAAGKPREQAFLADAAAFDAMADAGRRRAHLTVYQGGRDA